MAGTKPFKRRFGVDNFPRWRGVNKQGPPSGIALNELREGINVRFSGGQIVNRGGQGKLSENTVTGCVFGMMDNHTQQIYGVKLYITSGTALEAYSLEDTPNLQQITESAGALYNGNMVVFQEQLHYIGGGINLYKIGPVELLPGQSAGDVAGLLRGIKIASHPTGDQFSFCTVFRPTLVEEEHIFIGCSTDGVIWRWDGVSLVADSTALGATDWHVLTTYREDLFVFGLHYAKKRDGGTYTNISMPGGTTSFRPYDAVTYKDVLYIIGTDDIGAVWTPRILSWDGTTLAIANSMDNTGSIQDSSEGGRSLAVFNGYMFYGWQDPDGAVNGAAMLGRFDGSSWVDAHKDFHAQFGAGRNVNSLQSTPNSLFAALHISNKLVESPGVTTSGTWTDRGTITDTPTDIFQF